jgi:ABC-type multidrug transport system ATPase subunit
MPEITVRDVSVRFGRRERWVLGGITGTLPAGSVTAVTGRNGAGKTTLLRVLAGVLPATGGAVLGRPAVVGWVPERFPADQVWTVRQYLTTVGRVRGVDEPWEGLDAATRAELPALVAEVTAAGGVCVVSDHRGEIAGLRADAEWLLDEGRLTVRPATAQPDSGTRIIEIVVAAADAAATVAELEAAGHRVRAVRATTETAEEAAS